MKVLMVNKFLYPNGGSETYIFKLGEYLMSQGHEVQYFGMEHEGRVVGNHAEIYTDSMDFHTGKLQKLLYPFKIIYSLEAKKKMLSVLADFQPDVVHLNNINFQLTPSVIDATRQYEKKSGKKIRIIFTAHDYQWVCPNHMMRREATLEERQKNAADLIDEVMYVNCEACLQGNFSNCSKYRCIHGSRVKSILGMIEADFYKVRKTYGQVDTIICPSDFMKRKIDTNPLLRSKTIMIRNFIEKETRKKQLDDHKKDYVLYLGRFSEEKGIRTLLEVCKQCPDIHFVFAGNGPLEEEVNKLSNTENRGFVKEQDLKTLIQEARFSIYPSEWYENGPFSVMECLQAGTPVVGAAIGGIPELIHDGETGLLYESKNVTALKEKVEQLWGDRELNLQLIYNCQKINFQTVEEYGEHLLKVYENVSY